MRNVERPYKNVTPKSDLQLATEKLHNEMRGAVDNTEFAVLSFIFARTAAWGHGWHGITMKQFIHGHYKRDGEFIQAGCGLKSEAPVYKAIKSLKEKGIVLHRNGESQLWPEYSINMEWTLSRYLLQNPSILSPYRESLLSHEREDTLSTERHNVYTQCNNVIHSRASAHEGCSDKENVTVGENVSDTMARLRAVAASATDKTHAAAALKSKKRNPSAYGQMWKTAWIEAYPTERYFSLTMADLAGIKRCLDRGGVPEADREPFVTFVVSQWDEITRKIWPKYRERPPMPAPGWFIKWVSKYWDAFEDSRSPNRKLQAKIAAEPVKPKLLLKRPTVTNAEVEKLRNEKARLARELQDANLKLALSRKPKVPKPGAGHYDDGEFKFRDDD